MISSPPVDDETTFTNLRVAGKLPAALSGQYVVVGEAARVGERMLHVLTVAAGRAVSCRSHKVATDIVVAKVTAFGSKTLAFADGALAHELDTGSGTLRPVDLAGTRRRLVG